jgi:hypothetical protein
MRQIDARSPFQNHQFSDPLKRKFRLRRFSQLQRTKK